MYNSSAGTFAAPPSGLFVGHPPLGRGMAPWPKLVDNPLSRGGHTQIAGFGAFSKNGGTDTVPLGGACVESLNRYLKSLRNKRKETQKEQR